MLNQPQHSKTLFVFNDNEEQFDAFVKGEPSGFSASLGNAVIRPARELQPPRSAGIPTGSLADGGYRSLDSTSKAKIDEAMVIVQNLANSGFYDTLVFSKSSDGNWIGTGVFQVAEDVLVYIYDRLTTI